jgi:uncharacterized BrkB/YihY/UPF0761 family membrane protein
MSALDTRPSNAQLRRLQILLLLMILWNLLAVLAELSFGNGLMQIEGDKVGGLLAVRTSFAGAALVPMAVYLYGMVRNPMRHRGVILVAIVEQAAAALFAVYHVATNDIETDSAVLAVVVALVLLFLLLVNIPPGDGRGSNHA